MNNVYTLAPIPEIGKAYNCFDDGKIRMSRLYTVTVTNVVKFEDVEDRILECWKREISDCSWLYARETDVFVIATNDAAKEEIFVRTNVGDWFSIETVPGFCGRLDIDGKLIDKIIHTY